MTTSALDTHLVLPLDPALQDQTLELDNGKQFKPGTQHGFHVRDAAEAEALKQKYGKARLDYAKYRSPDVHDQGHRFFFGGWPEMPWKRKKVKDAIIEGQGEHRP